MTLPGQANRFSKGLGFTRSRTTLMGSGRNDITNGMLATLNRGASEESKPLSFDATKRWTPSLLLGHASPKQSLSRPKSGLFKPRKS